MSDDSVIDATADFELAKARGQFSRLAGIVERSRAEIEANPWPAIERLYRRSVSLERTLRNVEKALHPRLQMTPGASGYVDDDRITLIRVRNAVYGWRQRAEAET